MSVISIIMPVYNVEEYLNECIDSIKRQTFTDYELILVDDGSTDQSGTICDKYTLNDSRIKVIHQKNGGLSSARNTGLKIFNGEYVTFIDSDDLMADNFLMVLFETLMREKADISCCNFNLFKGECVFEKSIDRIICLSGNEATAEQYECGRTGAVTVNACAKLFSRQLFEYIRFPEGRIHEDQAIIPIILSQAKKVAVCSDKLYGYRMREGSIMHSNFSMRNYDDVIGVDECIEYFKKKNNNLLIEAASKRKKELLSYYSLAARGAGIYKEVPKKYRVSGFKAIKWLRKNVPYDIYEYRVAMAYPWLVFIEARVRKMRKMLGLRVKN